jgi:steroid 5-alpha reductase family enzyme
MTSNFDVNSLVVLSGVVVIAYQLLFFFIASTLKIDKVTDFAGGSNFLIIAIMTMVLGEAYSISQIVVSIGVVLWAIRISGFLLYRILKTGTDDRFDEIRSNFWKFLGFWIYQMWWVFSGSLSVIFMNANKNIETNVFGIQEFAGVAMFVCGFLIEIEADRSKYSFKSNENNQGKFCTSSVWKYSRHPNYFGEILLWWGIWIVAQPSFTSIWMYSSLLGPLTTMFVLFFLSGMNLSEPLYGEKGKDNLEYQTYRDRTSILIPLPNSLYLRIPNVVRSILLFEWPIYRYYEETRNNSRGGGSLTFVA